MENASKALIIAGGILISMIVISLFYFVFNNISTLVSNTDKSAIETETLEFNKGFTAYNKKLMYGTDVISVLNKAIDSNIKYGAGYTFTGGYNVSKAESNYQVDIIIKLDSALSQREETYTKKDTSTGYEKSSSTTTQIMKSTKSYSLNKDYKKLYKAILITTSGTLYDDEDGTTYNNATSSLTEWSSDGYSWYKITYYCCAEFKMRTFKCSKVEYNSDGRVSSMTFEEYK